MMTEIIRADAAAVSDDRLRAAAEALAAGEIVAFPTETVYGLGANAHIDASVHRIFALKGRPQDNPLIVHLPDRDGLSELVCDIPDAFDRLYRAFCPGPLTFVLPKKETVSDIVSAGLDTVAVRFPSQPVANRLLRLAGVPVVAPSANLSGRPSPTRAWHVLEDFEGRIPYVIDGGDTEVGVESTVLDLTSAHLRILRPGIITAADILARTGLEIDPYVAIPGERPRAPGMKYRHYSPRAEVLLVSGRGEALREAVVARLAEREDKRIGIFINAADWAKLAETVDTDRVIPYTFDPARPVTEATHHLFDALRTLDRRGVDVILAETMDDPAAEGYMNRLTKAAGTPGQPLA